MTRLVVLVIVLTVVARWRPFRQGSAWRLALLLVVFWGTAIVVARASFPELLGTVIGWGRQTVESGIGSTVAEARPLFEQRGAFTLAPLWHQFSISGYLALIGLGLLSRERQHLKMRVRR